VEVLLALINRARVKLAASGYNSPGAMIRYEAGYEGLWLYRRFIALGIRVVGVDPAGLLVDRRAMRAKTDRIEARSMVRALMAWARGERQVLSEVRVPIDEQDDARRGLRERQRLMERTTHGNRIKRFAEDTKNHGNSIPGPRMRRRRLPAKFCAKVSPESPQAPWRCRYAY
jgi:transposase